MSASKAALHSAKRAAFGKRSCPLSLVLEAPHRQAERLVNLIAVDLRTAGTEVPVPRRAATAEGRPEEPARPAIVERAPEGVAGEVSFKE